MTKLIPDLKIFLIFTLLSLVIYLIDNFGFLSLPKQAAFYMSNPISFGIYNTKRTIGKQFYFIFAARFAAQENKALQEQIGQLISENADLRKKTGELSSMVDQKDYLDPRTYNLVAARPIGLGRYLKIDKGSSSGIKQGAAVVFKDNFVGRVVSVSESSSNVQLLSDPDTKLSAFSQNQEGKAKGVLLGQFGTQILLDKILHEEKILSGDLVYSEGLEGFLPRGLIFGRVVEVLQRENEVFKQAKITPIFDIRDLELVFVMEE